MTNQPETCIAPGETVAQAELLSVLVPVCNEEPVLEEFHRRLSAVLAGIPMAAEVLYVDDGSQDRSMAVLARLRATDTSVRVLELSRNFGKEIAMAAGLDFVRGDAVVIIDADLQDPPELIPDMLAAWRRGYDQVEMRRISRDGESAAKIWTAHTFYRLIGRISDTPIPENVGDFRLLSRRAVEALRLLGERSRFMKGLFAWVGYPRVQIPYDRAPRQAGVSKWNYWKLWNFAIEGFTSFTVIPLKLGSYLGVLVALASFVYGIVVILKTLIFGDPVSGYPSLMVVVLFLGGVQLLFLGIVGEYMARMFMEAKQRPLYLVKEFHADAEEDPASGFQHAP